MNILLILPIVIPLLAAIAALLAGGHDLIRRVVALAGTIGLLVVGLTLIAAVWQNGIQATQIGDWPAPFGITIVVDLFSAIMVSLAGLMGLAVVIFSFSTMDPARVRYGFYPLVLVLLVGVSGAFITGDMFNLYVWFEVMLIASFVLMALGGERFQLQGAIKYFALNLLESTFFLSAVGLLYGITGTLNMADLATRLDTVEQPGLVIVLAMLFLVAFGIKAAVFPLFFWLPASYHTPPVAVTTLFSGLMTKVGVYALVRVFTLLFTTDVDYTHTIILIIAGLTMLIGVLGAVAQYDFRRLLSFHIISQIGYLLMGLGLYTVAALAATIFFMVHVIIAKAALFLVSGIAFRVTGIYDLKKLGGLYRGYPLLAVLFLLPALSLGGIPPLSGFWAKLSLVVAGLSIEQYLIVGVALVVSILTLLSMIKIWGEAFWKTSPRMDEGEVSLAVGGLGGGERVNLLLPLVLLAVLTVLLGVLAEPMFALTTGAAQQLMDPAAYIEAVMGS